jgi:DNA-directed RNA polymerase alpha subunit
VPLTENLETEEVSSLTEFTTIPFVRESFLEILLNLKACVFENLFAFTEEPNAEFSENWPKSETDSQVLKGKLILNASQESVDDPTEISKELFFQKDFSHGQEPTKGANTPGRRVREYKIWAKDLILPPGLKVKNPNLVLATLVAPKTNCELELNFEKIFQSDLTTLSMKTGRVPHRAEEKRRNVPIDGTLFPIKKVNFALSYTKFQKEIITFEIWTNGSVNPRQAIFQSVEKILKLFQNLREDQVTEIDAFAETALDEFDQAAEAESQIVEPE